MKRVLSLSALGLLCAGLLLANPAESRADGFGLNLNFGRGGVSFFSGNPYPCGPIIAPPVSPCAPAPAFFQPQHNCGPNVFYGGYSNGYRGGYPGWIGQYPNGYRGFAGYPGNGFPGYRNHYHR